MELQIAENEMKRMIALHCPNYKFKWDNAKARFGQCHYGKRELHLSKPLTLLNNQEIMFNTIIHEICHAITQGSGHNWRWKQKFLSMGGTGNRCSCGNGVEGKHVYVCPKCALEIKQHRASKKKSACTACCNKYNGGRFSKLYIFEKKE